MVETGDTNYIEKEGSFLIGSEILGKGSFSVVKSAVHTYTQARAAAKIIDLMKNKDIYSQEVSALSRINHPHIVKFLHSQVNDDGKGVIFLEHITYPTLQTFLQQHRTLPLQTALHLFAQLVDAIDHMHENYVAHSDLKAENLAYDPQRQFVKVFDFGLSQATEPKVLSSSFVGSPLYMAPEVLLREKYNPFAADIWSLAMVLIEMITGKTPFSSFMCLDELLDFVSFENYVPLTDSIPADLRELLRKMLDFNPTTRLTITSVRDFMKKFL